jgi:hypothetical protein
MRSTDFPFAVTPQQLQRGGRPDYSAPSAALAAVRANDGQQFGGISARDTSVRDQIKDNLAVIVGRRNADKLMGVGELLGADAPLMLDEARLAYREGRPGEAAATAALAVLPIPGAAKKGAKAAMKAAKTAAPVNPATQIARQYGNEMAQRIAGYVERDAPLSEWQQLAETFMDAGKPNAARSRPSSYTVKPAQVARDPRIEPRKKEQAKIDRLELEVQRRSSEKPPVESIYDLEGRGLITSMSDLSAAGDDVLAVNDVRFDRPFSRQGGQGFMFENPGEVWAADKANAEAHLALARQIEQKTGKPALFAPWSMGPLSSMFSHQPRGLQYAYANAALDAPQKAALAKDIKAILPDWRGFEDPDAYQTFMRAKGKARGQLNKIMDKYRDLGGLGKGEAVYGTTDLEQIGAPLLSLRNLGEIDTRFGVSDSAHPSYRSGVPGEGRAVLEETGMGALSLFPELMKQYGYATPFDFPVGVKKGVASPLRAFQMKPQSTIITEDVLRLIDDLRVKGLDKPS